MTGALRLTRTDCVYGMQCNADDRAAIGTAMRQARMEFAGKMQVNLNRCYRWHGFPAFWAVGQHRGIWFGPEQLEHEFKKPEPLLSHTVWPSPLSTRSDG